MKENIGALQIVFRFQFMTLFLIEVELYIYKHVNKFIYFMFEINYVEYVEIYKVMQIIIWILNFWIEEINF